MAYSGVWESLKNPNFQEISVFQARDGSGMPKTHAEENYNIFEKFPNFFHFFIIPCACSDRLLKF